jgi:hypothetical protein
VRTGAGGRYSVRLPAGVYAVQLSPPQKVGGLSPRQVRVPTGTSVRRDFAIDTGIR